MLINNYLLLLGCNCNKYASYKNINFYVGKNKEVNVNLGYIREVKNRTGYIWLCQWVTNDESDRSHYQPQSSTETCLAEKFPNIHNQYS